MKKSLMVLLPLFFGGCATLFHGSPGWNEIKLKDPLHRIEALRMVAECARILGMPVDNRLTLPEEGEVFSIWRSAPRYLMKSQRRRLCVELEIGENEQVQLMRYRVERELNNSMMLYPDPDEWELAGRVPRVEQLFQMQIMLRLDPELSKYKKAKKDLQDLPDAK